jgi:hypothetical protein
MHELGAQPRSKSWGTGSLRFNFLFPPPLPPVSSLPGGPFPPFLNLPSLIPVKAGDPGPPPEKNVKFPIAVSAF